jgi:hypothetical protein
VGKDLLDGDVEALQRIGKALCIAKVLGKGVPDDVRNSSAMKPRYDRAATVWNHYHRVFGDNLPLKRCRTGYKQWDINFEGVAHYGMIPDFLQDLSNVGVDPDDLSVLFKSAEHFAQMWTRTLDAADALVHPRLNFPVDPIRIGDLLSLDWFGEDGDSVEETDDLGDPKRWHASLVEVRRENGRSRAQIRVDDGMQPRFYRVRKR